MSALIECRPVAAFQPLLRDNPILAPLAESKVPAGFPSPAADYSEKFDVAAHLIKNEVSTFFFRVEGDSMIGKGIFDGDMIVVDRSLEPASSDVVLAVLDNEFTIKAFRKVNGRVELWPENPKFIIMSCKEGDDDPHFDAVTGCCKELVAAPSKRRIDRKNNVTRLTPC